MKENNLIEEIMELIEENIDTTNLRELANFFISSGTSLILILIREKDLEKKFNLIFDGILEGISEYVKISNNK